MIPLTELADSNNGRVAEVSISYIEDLKERGEIPPGLSTIIDTFLLAINDWPYPVTTFEDYALQVGDFVKGVATKERIEERLKRVDVTKDAWQGESLSQIADVFQFYEPGYSLKEIVERLRKELQS